MSRVQKCVCSSRYLKEQVRYKSRGTFIALPFQSHTNQGKFSLVTILTVLLDEQQRIRCSEEILEVLTFQICFALDDLVFNNKVNIFLAAM